MNTAYAQRESSYASGSHRLPERVCCRQFQTGLIVFMACRNPMRARNWCEALYDPDHPQQGNLRHDESGYYWHFAGDELKIGERKGVENVHEAGD